MISFIWWLYIEIRASKTAAYYISSIEIGLLWAKITYVKSHSKAFGLWFPNRYETDPSNEALNIDFSQGAAMIPEVKVGVGKKYLPIRLTLGACVRTGPIGTYYFWHPTLTAYNSEAIWARHLSLFVIDATLLMSRPSPLRKLCRLPF